jgi:SAM-dependent methyltransferase
MSRIRPLSRQMPPVTVQLGWRLVNAARTPGRLVAYVSDARRYRRLPGAEPLRLRDAFPQLADRTGTNPYDSHYFFQDVWAAHRVAEHSPRRHVDVGSRVDYVGFLTSHTDVTFVDIRPLDVELERLQSVKGSVLDLPFSDRSIESLSCLHVAEHIGLGRYGDPLDPQGSRKAAAELQRVLAPGGQLLFSGPVGTSRVCFNAHRIHEPAEIVSWFDQLNLVEFSGIDDSGHFARHRDLHELDGSAYACGLFLFLRPKPQSES